MMSQRILVVEDDTQIRKFICYCLENNDYEYITASNGIDALRKIANENIDLIVLDLGLPDNNQEIHVTPLEYQLLTLFMKNVGKVLTTSHIIEEIYGKGYGNDTQALRALMAGLRRKIEKNPATPEYILTEIGVGYRMKSDEE